MKLKVSKLDYIFDLQSDNIFIADQVLAKHDENYMPPEVAEALEAAGAQMPHKKNKNTK